MQYFERMTIEQLSENVTGVTSEFQAAWVGNAAAGLVTGQESIRGQGVLRGAGPLGRAAGALCGRTGPLEDKLG